MLDDRLTDTVPALTSFLQAVEPEVCTAPYLLENRILLSLLLMVRQLARLMIYDPVTPLWLQKKTVMGRDPICARGYGTLSRYSGTGASVAKQLWTLAALPLSISRLKARISSADVLQQPPTKMD